jgi:cystathionine gamma-synthase/methionine-gamma-lyase
LIPLQAPPGNNGSHHDFSLPRQALGSFQFNRPPSRSDSMAPDSASTGSKSGQQLSIDTLSVQSALHEFVERAKPLVPPIIPSVGFTHPTMLDLDQAFAYQGGATPADANAYVYARYGSPNESALEEAVAALEAAPAAISFGSGMAALHAGLLASVAQGSTVVAAEQLYGVTRTLLHILSNAMGLRVHYVDFLDLAAVREVTEATHPACLLCEVLTNPLVRVVEIDKVADIAHRAHATLLVDNTFATPFLLRPRDYGADIVIHSTTKFLNGHGDVLGGIALGSPEMMKIVYQYRRVIGGVLSPFDAWLSLRGIRTFAVRMRHACANAQRIAEWLQSRAYVSRVYYPGLPEDASHRPAQALFRSGSFGAMIAFEVKGLDRLGAYALVERLRLVRPVTSLGDVYTLIMHPASTSHRPLTPAQREAQGITEGTLRLSVGIEDAGDLIADLEQAILPV